MRKLLLATAATMLATGAAFAQPAKEVAAPGTIVVHLNGYFQYGVGAFGSSQMSGGSGTTAYKLNNVGTNGDFRIYPGFDAQTTNGIWYGVQAEIRTTTSAAGKSVGSNTTSSAGFSGLYVKRAYAYLGMPEYGFVRAGQTDSAFSLSQVGVIESFGDGAQFNSDGGSNQMLPTNPGLFIYADSSSLYATNKVVYESPAVEALGGKLSGIIGFEPSSNGIKEGDASVGSNAGQSDSSIYGGSNTRRRNTLDMSVSFANSMNGFANKVSVAYIHAAPLGILGAAPASAKYGYDELSLLQGGAQTTFAGLTVGGNIKWGQVEDGFAFKPKGARNALGYIAGASYNMGPYTVGASYFNEQSSGAYVPGSNTYARTLNEYGVAAGANYQIAKPIGLYLQYEYGHQHQPTTVAGVRSNVQEQIIDLGTTIKW